MTVHPELAGLWQRMPALQFEVQTLANLRQAMDDFSSRGKRLYSDLTVEEVRLERQQVLRIYLPDSRERAGSGALLYFHGGGFICGSLAVYDNYCRTLAHYTKLPVIAASYRLAPEHPYPAAIDDAMQAYHWLREHCEQLKVNPDLLGVVGSSAGGGLAVSLCLALQQHQLPQPRLLCPLYPMLDPTGSFPTMQAQTDSRVWCAAHNTFAWHCYLNEQAAPLTKPLQHHNWQNWPQTYSFIGGLDGFLDETTVFINLLKQSGVNAQLDVVDGAFHGFDILGNPRAAIIQHCWLTLTKAIHSALSPLTIKNNVD